MYYIYGVSVPSPLIESTDSMIIQLVALSPQLRTDGYAQCFTLWTSSGIQNDTNTNETILVHLSFC